MILPPRVSRYLGPRIPRFVVDFPFESYTAAAGILITVPILLDIVFSSLLDLVLPWPATLIWCLTLLLAASSLAVAIHYREAQMISASLWLQSFASIALVFLLIETAHSISWIVIAVGLTSSLFGVTRAVYWGALARLLS